MQEKYGETLKASLPQAHACLLHSGIMAVFSQHSDVVMWKCVLSSLTAARLRAVLSVAAPAFYKVQQRVLHAIDSTAREHPDCHAPPAAAVLCSVISRRAAAPTISAETAAGAADRDPTPRALKLLPKFVKGAADPGKAALSALPFVVACLAAPSQPVRGAAVDALSAMHAHVAAGDADLAPFAAAIEGARAAIVAAPEAFTGALVAAALPEEARAAVVRHILRRPFTLVSDCGAADAVLDVSGAALPDLPEDSLLADIAFEVGLPASAMQDARAVLSVHGAEATRLFAAATAAVEPAAEAVPAMQAVAAYVCRDGARLLREGHAAGELLGLVRDALRTIGGPAATSASRAAAVATVRTLLMAALSPAMDSTPARVRADQISSTLRCAPL